MVCIRKILIVNSKESKQENLNQKIQWFSKSLGMFNKRDKEKSCFRIFINLLKNKQPLSSEQIAKFSNLSRATVIHHLSKLTDYGLVVEKNKKYLLREKNFEGLTQKIEEDILSTFKKLKKISKEIDNQLNL